MATKTARKLTPGQEAALRHAEEAKALAADRVHRDTPVPQLDSEEAIAALGIKLGDQPASELPDGLAPSSVTSSDNRSVIDLDVVKGDLTIRYGGVEYDLREVAAQHAVQEQSEGLLIDLDQVAPKRRTIKRGGELFELYDLSELSLRDTVRVRHESEEFVELNDPRSAKDLDDTGFARLEQLIGNIFDRLLVGSDEVKASFGEKQKMQVVEGFTAPLAGQRLVVRALIDQSITANSSPDSTASTDPLQ